MSCTVYLLANERRGTYVGATVDLTRRLRQHNGELAGGSKQTAERGPWRLVVTVTGFACWRDALSFEFAWRRHCRRAARTDGWRHRALLRLLERPSPRVDLLTVHVHEGREFFSCVKSNSAHNGFGGCRISGSESIHCDGGDLCDLVFEERRFPV